MPASDANNNLCSAQYIREVMVSAGVTFKKGYGQNFLINPVVPKRQPMPQLNLVLHARLK